MGFSIPREFISGFEVLINLPLNEVKKIASFISTIPPGSGPKKFNTLLKSNFEIDGVSKLSSTIYSLGNLVLNAEESLEDLSNDLSIAINSSLETKLSDDKVEELKSKILFLVSDNENLKFTFKALNLLSENDIIYRKGRVITDIRLLFNEDINENNRKAVIIHRLKIESSKNNKIQDFYFSLDSKDLKEVRELINRALLKEEQVKANYNNINFIDITE